MRYNMLGAPQAKILWSAPSKSRFYYLFWLLELKPGHLIRSFLRILVLNPTHEISWSRSGFFSLRGRILRAGPPGPLCFLVFVFSPPPSALEAPGHPLNERSKTLGPVHAQSVLPAENTVKTDMRSHSLLSRLAYTLCIRSPNVGASRMAYLCRPLLDCPHVFSQEVAVWVDRFGLRTRTSSGKPREPSHKHKRQGSSVKLKGCKGMI